MCLVDPPWGWHYNNATPTIRDTPDRVSWQDMITQALWCSGYPQYLSTFVGTCGGLYLAQWLSSRSSWWAPTVLGTGIYTSRCSGRVQPDVAILTLNPTIALVRRRSKWRLGSGISLGEQMMKWAQLCKLAKWYNLSLDDTTLAWMIQPWLGWYNLGSGDTTSEGTNPDRSKGVSVLTIWWSWKMWCTVWYMWC